MSAQRAFPAIYQPLAVAIVLAVGIALGPVLDRWSSEAWPRWMIAATLAVIARRHRPLALATVVVVGSALAARAGSTLPRELGVDDRIPDRLVGVVAGPVLETSRGTGALLEVEANAEIWIWSETRLVAGERIAVTGLLRSGRGLRGPGLPDPRATADRAQLTAQQIERLGAAGGLRASTWRWAEATQLAWGHQIDAAGGAPTGRAALRGIVAGDRSRIPPALDERWRVVGIYHVLSVSGLHLAVVAGLVFALLRRLIAGSPWGGRVHPARWAAPPALALALGYTLVTGAQLATLRALLVITLVLIAAMIDRPVRLIDALGVAAIAILGWHPDDLYDPSFQLSFTAALTLALRPRADARGARAWIARGLATSAWMIVTTSPITAYHFQQVSLGGFVGNLALTPAIELVALPLALAGLALGSLGAPLVWLATQIVTLVDQVAGLLATVTPVGRIAVSSATAVLVLVAIALVLVARTRRTWLDAAAWGGLCLAWSLSRSPPPTDALRVTFLDIGQGDAAIVELPDGAVWLVDAGGHAHARDLGVASAPGAAIMRVLAAYGHARIDVAVISHPHPDHYLGLAGLALPIGELWLAAAPDAAVAAPGPLPSFDDLVDVLAARGTRVVHPSLGLARSQAGVELVVWAPRYQPEDGAAVTCAADPVRTVNDNSLVVSLHYRGRTLVFAGDLEAEGEELVVAAGLPRADVVKVPHHGSPTSSSPAFVAATRPALAVISCARGNSFGFPAPAVVERWRAAGADVARTDTDGAVTVIVDAAGRLTVDRFVVQSPGGESGARSRSVR